jgi:hypothetical protein
MEFSDGSYNTNIPNNPLSSTKFSASNDDILKEIKIINENLTNLIGGVKEILNFLKENSVIIQK